MCLCPERFNRVQDQLTASRATPASLGILKLFHPVNYGDAERGTGLTGFCRNTRATGFKDLLKDLIFPLAFNDVPASGPEPNRSQILHLFLTQA